MTVRDGMIQAIQARVLERNSYDESIDAELIESIASNIATGIEIKNPYKECGNSYVVYIETEKQWKTTIHYKKSSRISAAYFCVYRDHWYLRGKKGQ